jgi:hypothetical protein
MDKTLTRIIRILLDEIDRKDNETEQRLAELEAWQKQVEAVWPEVNDGTR